MASASSDIDIDSILQHQHMIMDTYQVYISNDSGRRELDLSKQQLEDADFYYIQEVLRIQKESNTPIQKLNLAGNRFTEKGINKILDFLLAHTLISRELTLVNISYNNLDITCVANLVKFINIAAKLEIFDINNCFTGEDNILNHTIYAFLQTLSGSLKQHMYLQHLRIKGNGMTNNEDTMRILNHLTKIAPLIFIDIDVNWTDSHYSLECLHRLILNAINNQGTVSLEWYNIDNEALFEKLIQTYFSFPAPTTFNPRLISILDISLDNVNQKDLARFVDYLVDRKYRVDNSILVNNITLDRVLLSSIMRLINISDTLDSIYLNGCTMSGFHDHLYDVLTIFYKKNNRQKKTALSLLDCDIEVDDLMYMYLANNNFSRLYIEDDKVNITIDKRDVLQRYGFTHQNPRIRQKGM